MHISRWILLQGKQMCSASSTTTTINMRRSATRSIRCSICIISAIRVLHLSSKIKQPQLFSTKEINMYKSTWTITCSHTSTNIISQSPHKQRPFKEIRSGESLDSLKRQAKMKSNNHKMRQVSFIKRVTSTAFSKTTTATLTIIDSLTSQTGWVPPWGYLTHKVS